MQCHCSRQLRVSHSRVNNDLRKTESIDKLKKMTNISSLPESELWKIDLKSDDPLDLFTTWHREANKNSTVACLSTSSANNKPHSRHVLLRHFDQNGFVFITDSRSRKVQELNENGMLASMCIFWSHHNDKNDFILRQARIEGKVEIIPRDEVKKYYDSDPLYTKIRAHLCHQDAPADWDELKKRHDELLEEARKNPESLPLPDHVIGCRLVSTWMEFYDSKASMIADRLEFSKNSNGQWTHRRLAA